MKRDSEIGAALEAGHPCYFVGFLPAPMPGQTIEDVCHAEAAFIEKVIERHPGAEGNPCLIGNCQAGWQIMLTSAIRPELTGPIILAGAPLSYWAGTHGKAPMRYTGGMLGGSWLATLASDLGGGIFDGAALVQNFENLNPANSYWSKKYGLYSKIDTEEQRFLDFEKWWGNPVLLNGEEIQFIVDELFVGNKLTAGKIKTRDGVTVDLRNIRSPIVVFCSHGDDITPPQQALDWILDLYHSDEEIIAAGQTIIYSLHASIGHLGIFVSGSVATKQHQEFAQNIDFIDALPPGLYEATFHEKGADTVHPELLPTDYAMSFIRARWPISARWEETTARTTPISRRWPACPKSTRSSTKLSCSRGFAPLATSLRRTGCGGPTHCGCASSCFPITTPSSLRSQALPRRFATIDTRCPKIIPCLPRKRRCPSKWSRPLDGFRDLRDHWVEAMFLQLYGSPLLQKAVGVDTETTAAEDKGDQAAIRQTETSERIRQLRATFKDGADAEAMVRALIYLLRAAPGIDERSFALLRQLRMGQPALATLTLADFKSLLCASNSC